MFGDNLSSPGSRRLSKYLETHKVVAEPDPYTDKEAYAHTASAGGVLPVGYYEQRLQTQQQPPRRNNSWLALAGVAILVAVLAGVIGGVVGWKVTAARNANNNNTSAAQTSGSTGTGSGSGSSGGNGTSTGTVNSTSTAGAAKAIRANSALAANGWRSSGDSDFSIRLSYQGPDNMLRYNQYSTIFGSWSPPHVIMAAAGAFPGTPLTATTIPYDMGLGYSQTQTELFWIASTNNRISGQNWRDGLPASGASDSIDSFMFTAGSGTRMASLWPSILVLDDNAQFKEVNYTSGIGFAASTLVTASSTPQPQQSSPLLALPRSTGHPGIEENVFYVSGNGALNVLARSASGAIVAAGKAFSMPANTSSLAGFAVAAKNTTDVISYVLWQDPSQGGIWMACLDPTAGGGWQSPTTDPVFADADVPTQLACVNVAVNWDGGSTMMPLLPNFDLSRCYFQAGGAIKEVLYDGTKWVDLGFIPMP